MLPTLRASLRHPNAPHGSAKTLGLVAFMAILCACQKTSQDHLDEAQSSLASSSYEQAIAAAEAGLRANPNERDAWGLELVKLEAYARGGNGESAKQQLQNLVGLYPGRLSPTDYSSTAQQLQAAGQGPAAIEVLDLGKKRYPNDELIEKMIANSVNAESSPEELEMLKSLGYIE